jgi:hypothetical protein
MAEFTTSSREDTLSEIRSVVEDIPRRRRKASLRGQMALRTIEHLKITIAENILTRRRDKQTSLHSSAQMPQFFSPTINFCHVISCIAPLSHHIFVVNERDEIIR